MPTTDYGVTVSDVSSELPFDTSTLSATSKVTTSDIEKYIDQGAARITAVLVKAGLAPGADPATSLDADVLEQAKEFIVQVAVVKTLDKLGFSGSARVNIAARERELYERYANNRKLIKGPSRVRSNVDTSRKRTFGRDYEW